MRIDPSGQLPELWKPVPYAVAPTEVGSDVVYAFGHTKERLLGFVMLFLLVAPLLVWVGWMMSLPARSPARAASNLTLSLAVLVALFGIAFVVVKMRRKSQVVVRGQEVQVQYNTKAGSGWSRGRIVVQTSNLKASGNGGSGSLWLMLMDKASRVKPHLVVIRNDDDFEIVGAFRSLDAAFDFAEIVQTETGLEVVEDEHAELGCVVGHRMLGPGSSDARALRRRDRSRPFRAQV